MQKDILNILKKISPDNDFEKSNDFIEDELLDSFDIISLIGELESAYGIEIDAEEILPENFNQISAIANLIKRAGGTVDNVTIRIEAE